ncbi:MAG: hypothetical protein ACRC0L_09485 [Angustibacter sp.]
MSEIALSQVSLSQIQADIADTRATVKNLETTCFVDTVDPLIKDWKTSEDSAGSVQYIGHEKTIRDYVEAVGIIADAFKDSVIDGAEATRINDIKIGDSFGGR